MGFLTNISISNDFWHIISKKPEALVDAITVGMNYGTDGPLAETFEVNKGLAARTYHRRYEIAPQGVTVHKAQHYDIPQVIVNTYGTNPIAAHELPYAIQQGWFDVREYNRQHAESVVDALKDLASQIERAIAQASTEGESKT